MRHFNDLAELSAEQVEHLLQLAARLDIHPEPKALDGKVLALLFLNPSLRTLASFQAAMIRLGGGAFVISPDMSIHGLETRAGIVMDGQAAEHIKEAVPVIASYGDALGIRAFAPRRNIDEDVADKQYHELAALAGGPVINMESAINHPCQSLADWKTLDDLGVPRNGGKFVLTWAYHPKPLPLAVPAATLHMAAMRGMEVVVNRPAGFELPPAVMAKARAAAAKSGGSVTETDDYREATKGAHIIYAKSWSSTRYYGDGPGDLKLREPLLPWCVSESWFDNARKEARFMHCLPVRRGVVVQDQVLDGPRSVVIQEARNRMVVQMAVLHHMLGGHGK
jgi:N-acetylornithine carbamoyltransferase